MQDLTNPGWIKLKGLLFLLLALMAGGLLLMEHFNFRDVTLFGIAVWCFCRSYYFAFYVIERYVDPTYRFSGLCSFARYLFKRGRRKAGE